VLSRAVTSCVRLYVCVSVRARMRGYLVLDACTRGVYTLVLHGYRQLCTLNL
jgi:hypothetical protein